MEFHSFPKQPLYHFKGQDDDYDEHLLSESHLYLKKKTGKFGDVDTICVEFLPLFVCLFVVEAT